MGALCLERKHKIRPCAKKTVIRSPVYNGKLYAVKVIVAWYEKYDPLFEKPELRKALCRQIMDTVEAVMTFMRLFDADIHELALALHYASMFVHKQKGIRPHTLVDIILTSAIVTMKFWNADWKLGLNKEFADLMGTSLKSINKLEMIFLATINYELYLSEEKVQAITDCYSTNSSKKRNHPYFSSCTYSSDLFSTSSNTSNTNTAHTTYTTPTTPQCIEIPPQCILTSQQCIDIIKPPCIEITKCIGTCIEGTGNTVKRRRINIKL